jgi:Putative peptidoglycan binding domain
LKHRTSIRKLGAVLAGTAFVVATLAPGAGAHSITGRQWTNVDTVCASSTCVVQGNLVGAWQSILWADGLLDKCGGDGIDGFFGTITKNATKSWQSSHDLSSDGIVGPVTWGAARNKLKFKSASITDRPNRLGLRSTVEYWDYVGSKHTVHFQYNSPTWAFRAPANPNSLPYYATTHPSIFFYKC